MSASEIMASVYFAVIVLAIWELHLTWRGGR